MHVLMYTVYTQCTIRDYTVHIYDISGESVVLQNFNFIFLHIKTILILCITRFLRKKKNEIPNSCFYLNNIWF